MRLSRLAEMLTLNYCTIYEWVRRCNLPAFKVNGSYWIDPKLAARWWREHSTTSAKASASGRTRPTKTRAGDKLPTGDDRRE